MERTGPDATSSPSSLPQPRDPDARTRRLCLAGFQPGLECGSSSTARPCTVVVEPVPRLALAVEQLQRLSVALAQAEDGWWTLPEGVYKKPVKILGLPILFSATKAGNEMPMPTLEDDLFYPSPILSTAPYASAAPYIIRQ